ncbi:hypothetical protein HOV93_06950 [Planctomycetes bacterium FF15]|uniref:Uncharacterized protein n=1 Tax=Bremerella alba TaxID=980252 RepID=A0A7V8V2E9_9BACT|nr:hypothetical protein [Bremerella alba]
MPSGNITEFVQPIYANGDEMILRSRPIYLRSRILSL